CMFDASNIDYWFDVQSIVEVFETVMEGMQDQTLQDGFVVALIDRGAEGMKAGVLKADNPVVGTTPSRIRQLFGYEDEWGHTPWFPMIGPICLNISYYFGSSPPARSNSDSEAVWMARTLVHEGTHKWAQTKDILYKHSSYGKIATEHNKGAKKW